MIIYNVTMKAGKAIAAEWLKWLLEEHIPEIMETGCFTDYRVVRLLETDDNDGPTYAVQYHAASKADYNRYMSLHATRLQHLSFKKWGDGYVSFQSVMQVVK